MTKISLDITSCHLAKENVHWRGSWRDSVLIQIGRWNYYTFSLALIMFWMDYLFPGSTWIRCI